jgi:hypothetical protein
MVSAIVGKSPDFSDIYVKHTPKHTDYARIELRENSDKRRGSAKTYSAKSVVFTFLNNFSHFI